MSDQSLCGPWPVFLGTWSYIGGWKGGLRRTSHSQLRTSQSEISGGWWFRTDGRNSTFFPCKSDMSMVSLVRECSLEFWPGSANFLEVYVDVVLVKVIVVHILCPEVIPRGFENRVRSPTVAVRIISNWGDGLLYIRLGSLLSSLLYSEFFFLKTFISTQRLAEERRIKVGAQTFWHYSTQLPLMGLDYTAVLATIDSHWDAGFLLVNCVILHNTNWAYFGYDEFQCCK